MKKMEKELFTLNIAEMKNIGNINNPNKHNII